MNKYYFNQKTVLVALMLATCLLPSLTMQSSTIANQDESSMLRNNLTKMGETLKPSDNAIINYMIQTRDQGRADKLSQPLYKGLFGGTFSPEGALETFNAIKKLVKLGYPLRTITRPLIEAYSQLVEEPVWAEFKEKNVTKDQIDKALKIYQILTDLVDYKEILPQQYFVTNWLLQLAVASYDNPIITSIINSTDPQASTKQIELMQLLHKYANELSRPDNIAKRLLRLALVRNGMLGEDLRNQYTALSAAWRDQIPNQKEFFKINGIENTDTLESFWNLFEDQKKENALAALIAFIDSEQLTDAAAIKVPMLTPDQKKALINEEDDKYILFPSDQTEMDQLIENATEFNKKIGQFQQMLLIDLEKLNTMPQPK